LRLETLRPHGLSVQTKFDTPPHGPIVGQ
jgi:hypothetical protein